MGRVGCVAPTLLPSLAVSVCSLRAALARRVPIIQSCQMNRARRTAIAFYYEDKRQCGIHDNCRPIPFSPLPSPNAHRQPHTLAWCQQEDDQTTWNNTGGPLAASLLSRSCNSSVFSFFIKFNFKAFCRIFKLHCKLGKLSEQRQYVWKSVGVWPESVPIQYWYEVDLIWDNNILLSVKSLIQTLW